MIKNKKIISILMIICIILGVVQPIFAASGTGTWTGGQYASGIKTTDNQNTTTGVVIRRLNNTGTGEKMTVFCAEHGVDFDTGVRYNGSYYTPTSASLKQSCKIAYFGWYSKYGEYAVDGYILSGEMYQARLDYVFTQQYIWEVLGQSSATFIDGNIQNQYINFKNTINNQINSMQTRPSFDNATVEVTAGESKTIVDNNGVLKDYSSIDATKDGVRFQHNYGENTLTITVSENCTIENLRISDAIMSSWGMVKEETKDCDTSIYFAFDTGSQAQLYSMNYNDPVPLAMSLKINLLGNLELTKLNENGDLVNGSIFKITGPNNYNQNVTVTNGRITLEKIRKGIYSINELSAPNGYLLNTETYNVEVKVNQTAYQTIVNDEPTGNISIIKRDLNTGSVAQGDATLENAIYKVYANEDIYNVAKTKKYYSKGDLVATRNTDKSGNSENITELPLGKYIVKEEKAPIGYLIDDTVYEVNLTYKDQNTKIITNSATSKDKVKEMQVHIFKSGIKENSGLIPGLEGAEFTIKLNKNVQTALDLGYTYAEIWNGIDEYGNKVEVNDKRVSEAQNIAPTYESITTDENGDAYTTNKLPYGKYIVKETNTPKDFYTADDFTFSITQDESEIKEVAKKVKNLYVNNEQMETYIKLVKKDKETGRKVTLSSATFQITATKDIYDRGNGKIIYKKGEIITQKVGSTIYNSFTTGSDNLIISEGSYNNLKNDKGTIITPLLLPVGEYQIKEINIPKGFLQLENPVTFKVDGIKNYDKDDGGDYIKTVEITNEQPKGTIIIDKTIVTNDNVDKSLINFDDLSGIEFKLYAKEDIIDAIDGSKIYKKGQEISTYNLNKEGNLKIYNLPLGNYEIQESKTLDGLVLNKDKINIIFEQKDTTTKEYIETRKITNEATIIEVSKSDITGEKELEGAKLSIIDSKGQIVDNWTSTRFTHKIEGLVAGNTYILREEIAPNGYVKSTDVEFIIQDTAEIQKVNMIDKIVEISKTDLGGTEIEGAEMTVTDEKENIIDSWISTKEPHRISGLEENKDYILHELVAPNGYTVATDIKFTVNDNKETQKLQMIDKIVEISKQNIAGEEIEGATMIVTNTKTKNIVDKWESSTEPHIISGLIEGERYNLHEEIAIDGYVKATDIEFEVTLDKETQKIVMIDKIIDITKKDLTNGNEIEGAELIVTDKNNIIVDSWISTKEPHHVTGLLEGEEYTLTEKTAPYGYEKAENINFTVSLDKDTQIIEMKDMPILKSVQVEKIDESTGEHIKSNKFVFGIYEDAECTKLIKESGANEFEGTALFGNLRYGTYYIKEINAPLGYKLSNQVVKIDINDKGVFADGISLEEKDEIYSFIYYNSLLPAIQTGNETNYVLLISLIGISIIGITTGTILLKNKRCNNK